MRDAKIIRKIFHGAIPPDELEDVMELEEEILGGLGILLHDCVILG